MKYKQGFIRFKIFFFIIFAVLFSYSCDLSALEEAINVDQTGKSISFGDDNWTWAAAVEGTADGGFVAAGVSAANPNPDMDILLFKSNSNGSVNWHKTYSFPDRHSSKATDLAIDDEGNIVITGTARYPEEPFIIKTDPQGKKIWADRVQRSTDAISNAVTVSEAGSYILAGTIEKEKADGMFLRSYSDNGEVLMTRTVVDTATPMQAYDIAEAGDGFVVTGSTRKPQKDILLTKLTSDGKISWQNTPGDQATNCHTRSGQSIITTSDGYLIGVHHAIVCGHQPPSWGAVIKTGKNGTKKWSHDLGGSALNEMIQTGTGEYLGTGTEWVGPLNGTEATYLSHYVRSRDSLVSNTYRYSMTSFTEGFSLTELVNGKIAIVGQHWNIDNQTDKHKIYLVVAKKPYQSK